MSDQNITQLHHSLKELNTRLQKLTRLADQLDILAYQQKRLSQVCQELIQLMNTMGELDLLSFQLRQEIDVMRAWEMHCCHP